MYNKRLHLTKPLVTPLAGARAAPIDFAGEAQRYGWKAVVMNATYYFKLISIIAVMGISTSCSDSSSPVTAPEPRDPRSIPDLVDQWAVGGEVITTDNDGLVYVLPDYSEDGAIDVYSQNGEVFESWVPELPNEVFWAKYIKFSQGQFVIRACGFPKPARITLFGRNREYKIDYFEVINDCTRISGADLLTVGPDGSIYTMEYNEETVYKYNSRGTLLAQWSTVGSDTSGKHWPGGIAVTRSNKVFISDTIHNIILVFSDDGELLAELGALGQELGQFFGPTGLAVDGDDIIYVADSGNLRIQKISSSGDFLGEFPAGEVGHEPSQIAVSGPEIFVSLASFGRGNGKVLHYSYDD